MCGLEVLDGAIYLLLSGDNFENNMDFSTDFLLFNINLLMLLLTDYINLKYI